MASLILVKNVVGELQPKRTLAASRGFLAAARLSCRTEAWILRGTLRLCGNHSGSVKLKSCIHFLLPVHSHPWVGVFLEKIYVNDSFAKHKTVVCVFM